MSKTIKSSARNVLFRLISSYPHELNEVQKNRREINASLATIENIAGEIQEIEKKNDLKNALLSLRIKLLPREEYTEKKTSGKCVFSNSFMARALQVIRRNLPSILFPTITVTLIFLDWNHTRNWKAQQLKDRGSSE